VNDIFANYETYSGPTLILGAIYFAFQIYGDFSGYSDIAIGTARLFGISLMTNFKTPYFARDIAEFWRRWHISLSTWFRDYLYIPLGGSRVGKWKAVRNTFVIFLVSGFWHGANWTFIVWGGIHAVLFLPLLLAGRNRRNTGDIQGWPSVRELLGMAWTFAAVTVAWVFFRAESVGVAVEYLTRMAFNWDALSGAKRAVVIPIAFIPLELISKNHADPFGHLPRWIEGALFGGLVFITLACGFSSKANGFIYFQF
jgi:D-alanyl-lipoteichoic acid acyltransferase DltB (MBOAT superfamily)